MSLTPTLLDEKLGLAAAALKALGNPIRLDIIISLENYEMNVTTLSQVTEVKQYTLSKHLRILSEAGLIQLRREGRTHYYRLKNPELTNLLTQLINDRL